MKKILMLVAIAIIYCCSSQTTPEIISKDNTAGDNCLSREEFNSLKKYILKNGEKIKLCKTGLMADTSIMSMQIKIENRSIELIDFQNYNHIIVIDNNKSGKIPVYFVSNKENPCEISAYYSMLDTDESIQLRNDDWCKIVSAINMASLDSVIVDSHVEFYIYNGPYGEKENVKEPAIKLILTVKNLGNNPIPDLDVTNRSKYVNLYINDTLDNPVSLYNGSEVTGEHLIKKNGSDNYIWWFFEKDAYGDVFTFQWQYMGKFSKKIKINVKKKIFEWVK
jgi:hypothetical protein